MEHDEVPKPVAAAIGHVCGVIAVGMAALGLVLICAAIVRHSAPASVGGGVCIGIATLLFRWAGALTGFWNTSGRLAVPNWVYRALGVMFAVLAAYGTGVLILQTPRSFDELFVAAMGVVSSLVLTWLCRLASQRFG